MKALFCSSFFILSICMLTVNSCKKEQTAPTVVTKAITDITYNSAIAAGEVTDEGSAEVTERGICWGTAENPTTGSNKIPSGNGTGSFTSSILGLQANETYHVRAYATNSVGTAYGVDSVFVMLNETDIHGNVEDIDGNSYTTIQIGTQNWMAENLKTTKYADGTVIPNITDQTIWESVSSGAWCNYNNNADSGAIYGKLYNWYTVSDTRNVCPTGWHAPTDAEWVVLTDFLGGESVAGSKMKTTSGWTSSNTTATNESGFSGLPGGQRSYFTDGFTSAGNKGFWWSSSDISSTGYSWSRFLLFSHGFVGRTEEAKKDGFSVRCLED